MDSSTPQKVRWALVYDPSKFFLSEIVWDGWLLKDEGSEIGLRSKVNKAV